jgi:hypothetical protein
LQRSYSSNTPSKPSLISGTFCESRKPIWSGGSRNSPAGKIDRDEFKSAVQGQLDVAEMRALKQAELAQVRIDIFASGVLDIVVSAAFAAIP